MQRYLVSVALLLVLLMCVAAALLMHHIDRFGRSQAEQQLLATTRALSLAVDGDLRRFEATARAISQSDAALREDWASVDGMARRLISGTGAWLVVGDREGRQLVNTRLPPGTILPGPAPLPELWAELDSGRSRTCNLSRGRIEPAIICVDVPIMRGGRATHMVSVVMPPRQLGTLVGRQRVGPGNFATVVDRRGIVVWRNVSPESFMGRPATRDILEALAQSPEGVRESHSLEGVPTVAAYSRSPFSGWTFIVAVPRTQMHAGTARALRLASAGAVLLLIMGAVVGLIAARRVNGAVRKLAATASQIERGETPRYEQSGLIEIDAAGQLLEETLRARKLSEERYARIFEQTSDLILTADLKQVITDCNPSAAHAVGFERSEAIGRKISEFVSPEDFKRTTDALHQKIEAGGTTRYDVRVRSRSGEWLFWEINSGLTYDRNGVPVELHVVGRDITERKRAEEHQHLLINELNHRVKNTLAVIQGIAHQTLRPGVDLPAAREALEGRLSALSAAHDVLTRESWSSASMAEIVRNAVAPFCDESRCSISGPDLRLNPRTAVSFALAIHELATNAVKHGALSNGSGRILVSWSTGEERLSFTWREEGGPPVAQPSRTGFGSRMIERALPSELGASVQLTYAESGLIFHLDAPLPKAD